MEFDHVTKQYLYPHIYIEIIYDELVFNGYLFCKGVAWRYVIG
jgi:hypothetical protein